MKKVGIIGIGHVGAHVMSSLCMQGIADEVVLVDINEQKAYSEMRDMQDTATFLPHPVRVRVGQVEDLADCAVIVNSVGKINILRENANRVAEMAFTVPAVKSYAGRLRAAGFQGVLVNVTNPCDVITELLAQELQLPKGRVFGTGTGLDTLRLRTALSKQTGIDPKSVTAYMMGEHGAEQFAPWSCVSFLGKPLSDWAKEDARFDFDKDALEKQAIGGGWAVFSGKYCTEYAISAVAARMVSMVLCDEQGIMPASCGLCGEYGEQDVFAGVPAIIGKDGARVLELPLLPEELARFHSCCEGIRRNRLLGANQDLKQEL